jgi:asparagine synthase (glutamine-hydrolysing)
MSGIAGVVQVDKQPVADELINDLLDLMAHRGPDGKGLCSSPGVGLGHRMLRTTPESRHDVLPLRSASDRFILTADARIDNRAELLTKLNVNCRAPSAVGDGQLILAAYERWGRLCLDHLVGAFALAIWDERERVLFCARDHFGIRPFYFHWLPGRRLVFASELRPLFRVPGTPRRVNESRVADFLLDLENDKTATYYQDIFRLPPGHWLEIRDGRLSLSCYWSPDATHELRLSSDREYADAFRDLFMQAVRDHMRCSRPWGVCLSGGLDSTSVACVARKLLAENGGKPLHCVCIYYDTAPEGDEREFFQAVIEQGGITPHYLRADGVKPLDNLLPLLECYDGPINNPHFTLGWSVWQEIRRQNLDVLMDGTDGDVTVSYAFVYLQELARQGRWLNLFQESLGLARSFFGGNTSPFSVMWHLALKPLLPRVPRLGPVRWWETAQTRCINGPIIRAEFARRMHLRRRLADVDRRERTLRTSRVYHCEEVTHGVVVASLENCNKLCSAFGIEPRHPFFDKRLIEFCISLPREQRVCDGWTRMIVRRALADLLPEKVLHRGGKWGPGQYFARRLWLLDRPRLEEALTAQAPLIEPYIGAAEVRAVFRRFAARPTVDDAYRLWNAMSLGAWLQFSGVSI